MVKNFYDPEYQYSEDGEWNWDDWDGGESKSLIDPDGGGD